MGGAGAGVATVGKGRRVGEGGGGEETKGGIIELFYFYFSVTFVVTASKWRCG